MTDAGLVASFEAARGSFTTGLELEVPPGSVTALVGPNGAGKSTALRVVSGLLSPRTGRITLNGRVLDDAASGIHVAASRRGIGVVFQEYLLFPHLTAVDNVAFGLVAGGKAKSAARQEAELALDRLGIRGVAASRPRDLSGGQAQRVALARALILAPALLLLDEPLAALDATTRLEVRADLATRLRAFGGSTVLVTHDPIDALTLADEILVVDSGLVVQRGSPRQISAEPVNTFVADLLGVNVLRLRGRSPLVFSPGRVGLSTASPASGSALVSLRCRVRGVEDAGGRIRVFLETAENAQRLSAEVGPAAFAALRLTPGQELWASVLPAA